MNALKTVNTLEIIYKKLNQLIDFDLLKDRESLIYKAPGYMDLHVEFLYDNESSFVISLTHYYKQNGDMMKDPDMEINILPGLEMAEALTFEQSNPPIYLQTYSNIDGQKCVNMKNKRENNHFLNKWLSNLKKQGFNKPESN